MAGTGEVEVVEVRRSGPLIDAIYADILRPSFPPDELVTLAALRAGITAGRVTLTVALGARGEPVGAAIGTWSAAGRVMMLSYLAARPGGRGQGIGGLLLASAVRAWSARQRPCLIVAEVERPDRHRASLEHGDPVARLRFYRRHGARVLHLPYFQPALSADTNRAYGMLLISLHVPDEYLLAPDALAGEPVRLFWDGYLADSEGDETPGDPAARAMSGALSSAAGIPLLAPEDYRRIPAA